MQRVLALYIPFLSTDRLRIRANEGHRLRSSRRPQDNGDSLPVATLSPSGQTLRIATINAIAQHARIHPGQTLTDAKAILPELITYDDDPAADRQQLETLAIWAQCLSPTIHIEGHDTLFIDITGCQRLFDGETNLLDYALGELNARGFTVRGAVADTPGAAWAIAHAHPQSMMIAASGASVAKLASLPTWSLRIEPKTVIALASVGVETIASLLHLPRSSLAQRFGSSCGGRSSVLARIDQALGDLPEPLTAYRSKPVLTRRIAFGAPTTCLDLLTEAIHWLTKRFCETLDGQAAGVSQVFVTFRCPALTVEDGPKPRCVTIEVNLSKPTRSAKHLLSLLKVRLDALRLPAPTDSLMMWARRVEPLDDQQVELFDTGNEDAQAMNALLDRLVVRLSRDAVACPQLLSEHQPERAFRYVSVVDAPPVKHRRHPPPPSRVADLNPRPLRLSSQPIAIVATSIVPDGPPIAFRHNGIQHTVFDSVGPERIETGWWRGPHVQRDYYRITTKGGRRFWMFRDRESGKWFLHGWFD